MSFMFELRKLIEQACSDLSDLQNLLDKVQAFEPIRKDFSSAKHQNSEGDTPSFGEKALQIEQLYLQVHDACQKVHHSLESMDSDCERNTHHLEQLGQRIAVYLENLKRDALSHLDKGEFKRSFELLQFLSELEPENRGLQECLEISRQEMTMSEVFSSATAPTLSASEDSERKIEPVALSRYSPSLTAEAPHIDRPAQDPDSIDISAVSEDLQTEPTSTNSAASEHAERETAVTEEPVAQSRYSPSLTTEAPHIDHPAQEPDSIDISAVREEDLKAEPTSTELVFSEKSVEIVPILQQDKPSFEQKPCSVRKPLIAKLKRAAARNAVLLFLLILGVHLLITSRHRLTGSLEIFSHPEGAEVLINGIRKGQTVLRLNSLAVGEYEVRIEKAGYAPLLQKTVIQDGQAAIVAVKLESLGPLSGELAQMYDNGSAVIGNQEWNAPSPVVGDRSGKELLQSKVIWSLEEEPKGASFNSGDTSISKNRLGALSAVSLGTAPALIGRSSLQNTAIKQAVPGESLHEPGVQMQRPPTPRVEIPNPRKSSLINPPANETPLKEIENDLQTQDSPDKEEQLKRLELSHSWVQKAELAMGEARHVILPYDNVIVYANQALAIDPQNQEAQALKKESIVRAIAQSRAWIQSGKFDEARDLYSSLYHLSHYEALSPLTAQELKNEVDKLETRGFPVIHVHLVGSCTGRLRMNGYIVSFVPSAGDDGFTEKLQDVSFSEPSDKLEILTNSRNYHFRSNLAQSKDDNRQKLKDIHTHLMQLMAKAR